MLLRKRERKLIALFLAVAMLSTINPVLSLAANTYNKTVFVRDDGIYDAATDGTQISDEWIKYEVTSSETQIGTFTYRALMLEDAEITTDNSDGAINLKKITKSTVANADIPDVAIYLFGNNVLSSKDAPIQCDSGMNVGFAFNSNYSGTLVLKCQNGPVLSDSVTYTVGVQDDNGNPVQESVSVYASKNYDGSELEKTTLDNVKGKSDYKYVKIGFESDSDTGGDSGKSTDNSTDNGTDTASSVSYNITIEKDLGKIGGHQVSVNYTSNLLYDGRKKVQALGSTKKNKKESKSADPCIDIDVFVDGVALGSKYITADIKNNRDIYNKVKGSTVSGGTITLKINNDSSYGKDFAKAMKNYFKQHSDALKFYILPKDIKTANVSGLKSKSKIKGTTINKLGKVTMEYKYGSGIKAKKETLKWDKKGGGSKRDMKKDFSAYVSSNGLVVLTGQGNYGGELQVSMK